MLLSPKQGWIRARAGQVDWYMPGVYTGPMLTPGRAEKLAKRGLQDCEIAESYVTLTIPGHYTGRLPADQARKLFVRLRDAAIAAKRQHDNDHIMLLTDSGVRYVR